MKKKVLINCYEYPPSIHGGVGSFTRDLAEGLTSNGWDVTVIGIYQSNILKLDKKVDEVIKGVRVIRIPNSLSKFGRLNILFDRWRLWKAIKELHKRENFDLFESPESTGWLPFGSPIRPFIVRIHGAQIFFDNELGRAGSRLWHYFEKATIRKADHLIAVSQYCGERTLSLIQEKEKLFKVIYNGIDLDKIDKVKLEFNGLHQTNDIVFANSVIPKKGVEELIKAFNSIANSVPESRLIIVGKSLGRTKHGQPYLEYLKSLISSDVLHRVIFTGWLDSHVDVLRYLSTAKLCVYPSHMEGQGIAPTEAMALEKPVLFMENGPGREVIENEFEGLLINGRDPKNIADGILKVFNDYNKARVLGKNARKKVESTFDKKEWLKVNIAAYERWLGSE